MRQLERESGASFDVRSLANGEELYQTLLRDAEITEGEHWNPIDDARAAALEEAVNGTAKMG